MIYWWYYTLPLLSPEWFAVAGWYLTQLFLGVSVSVGYYCDTSDYCTLKQWPPTDRHSQTAQYPKDKNRCKLCLSNLTEEKDQLPRGCWINYEWQFIFEKWLFLLNKIQSSKTITLSVVYKIGLWAHCTKTIFNGGINEISFLCNARIV